MSKKILLCALLVAGAPMAMAQTAAVIINKTTTTSTTAVIVGRPAMPNTAPGGAALCKTPALADVTPPVTPSVDAGGQAAGQRNFALARANFQPLADQGDVAGERALGQLLMRDCTGLKNIDEGLKWLTKAADGGNNDAALDLGSIYFQGRDGVPIDDNKALALLSKAAASGLMVAETDLAYMYLNGRGTPVDKYQGMVWAVKGGEQGSPAAMSYIANAYYKGIGLPKDMDKAALYIAIASLRGDATQQIAFRPLGDNISRDMEKGDIKSVAQDAVKWTPGAGKLSQVLRDAGKWRDQQPKAQAKN